MLFLLHLSINVAPVLCSIDLEGYKCGVQEQIPHILDPANPFNNLHWYSRLYSCMAQLRVHMHQAMGTGLNLYDSLIPSLCLELFESIDYNI